MEADIETSALRTLLRLIRKKRGKELLDRKAQKAKPEEKAPVANDTKEGESNDG